VFVGASGSPFPVLQDGPDKSRLREIRLEFSGPKAIAEIPIGIPRAQEPWAIRIKL